MKTWQKLGIILGTVVLCILAVWLFVPREKGFVDVPIDRTQNRVFNLTQAPFLDTIVHVGLNLIDVKGIVLIIRPLGTFYHPDLEGIDVDAYIQNQGNQYVLWIKDLQRWNSIRVISHELIHIRQYYRGELEIVPNWVTWKGITMSKGTYSYMDSPWEKEAYGEQGEMETQLRKVLYGKT